MGGRGVFRKRSDLDSGKTIRVFKFFGVAGGCSGKGQIWTAQYYLGGGAGFLNQIPEQGVLRNLSTNFALPHSES